MKRLSMAVIAFAALLNCLKINAQEFKITESEYLNNCGVDVVAFSDYYPEGHQGGVTIIMNGKRLATNGDVRLEPTPGQWQPVPKKVSRQVDGNVITATMCFPDTSRHLKGFNPAVYPDLAFYYKVETKPEGNSVVITISLEQPVPKKYEGKVGFNLEFFPGELFGKPWIMDSKTGIFPQQPNAPLEISEPNIKYKGDFEGANGTTVNLEKFLGTGYSPLIADDIVAKPYAEGKKFVSCPDDPLKKITIESETQLKLYDGRINHNNGWFVLRSELPTEKLGEVLRWKITPNVDKNWLYAPVVQTSQIGYMTSQPKRAIIEVDRRDNSLEEAKLIKITAEGENVVLSQKPQTWGNFLRYNYLTFDFSFIKSPGLYKIVYKNSESVVFKIDDDVFERGVWQPVIEYFLPVQMCHVRVNEKYKVWHDVCHLDDALVAEKGNLFDGYDQTDDFKGIVPNEKKQINVGGWHDAGDFDLRIESQANECYILALAYECFKPEIDVTSIDWKNRVVEIHQPDEKNDILQQIENGALTIIAGYNALGRLYRGIICNSLRQYVLLGDAAAMTDNIAGNNDDRRVYTENNPYRELSTSAGLAATYRALKGFNDTLANRCLEIAQEVYNQNKTVKGFAEFAKVQAEAELFIATNKKEYLDNIITLTDSISKYIGYCGWYLSRIEKYCAGQKDMKYKAFSKAFRDNLTSYAEILKKQTTENPYGVPYSPRIWGAGWDIQSFGFKHYFLANEYPQIFDKQPVFDALNFILGCHPGLNRASFASGVGAESAIVGYGLNRSDWSYIPGGVVSGTNLVRPDFPELLTFPYLWQQVEYVIGGGSSHYMFLVLAAEKLGKNY
ncbi:MAG: glycoside hydrolase family 9 protein [Bacteroidales bacterium]|nr:glycoside hydrolase family 9 protein [Bacteroidales bacterium]